MSTTPEIALIHRLERHLLSDLSPETQHLAQLAFYSLDHYLAQPAHREEQRADTERRCQRLFRFAKPDELPLIRALLGTRHVFYRRNETLVLPDHLPPIPLNAE